MISTAAEVVSIALSYVGATQGSAKHRKLIKAFNSVKPHGYTASVRDYWCAEAWSAWQILAGNSQNDVPMSCNCGQIIADAKRLGIWIESDGFRPSKGDAILYDWEDSGRGDNTGTPNHIGMVYDVDSKWIYVVEGNKHQACGRRAIAINGSFIRGFVHPHYRDSEDIKKVEVDGWWGYYTTLLTQKKLGTYQDGIVSGQSVKDKKYVPRADATWQFDGGGSQVIKAIQKMVGATVDGYCGEETVKAIQRFLGVKEDGIMGEKTVKAWQKWLNGAVAAKTNKLVEMARLLAWAKGTDKDKYAYHGGSATKAFKVAIDKVFPDRKSWSRASRLGCSCDVFVSVVVRNSVDKKYPATFAKQWKYESPHMKKITKKNVDPFSVSKDGDIILYKGNGSQHTLIRADGVIYEAQREKTYGHVNVSLSKLKKKRGSVVIFRYV